MQCPTAAHLCSSSRANHALHALAFSTRSRQCDVNRSCLNLSSCNSLATHSQSQTHQSLNYGTIKTITQDQAGRDKLKPLVKPHPHSAVTQAKESTQTSHLCLPPTNLPLSTRRLHRSSSSISLSLWIFLESEHFRQNVMSSSSIRRIDLPPRKHLVRQKQLPRRQGPTLMPQHCAVLPACRSVVPRCHHAMTQCCTAVCCAVLPACTAVHHLSSAQAPQTAGWLFSGSCCPSQ